MARNRIRLATEDGAVEMEILEKTTLQGMDYILVTDAPEGEDGECFVMKDISRPEEDEASYVFAEDEESEALLGIFSRLLEGEDIRFEK